MSAWGEVLVGLVVLIGLIGVILPVLPGSPLVLAAIAVWAWVEGTAEAWTVFAVGALLIAAATVVKYAWPGQRLRATGIPTATLAVSIAVGIVGFFVIPVIGLPLGFVLGIYVGELRRLGSEPKARAATVAAVKAVGLSILVELVGATAAAALWLGAAVLA